MSYRELQSRPALMFLLVTGIPIAGIFLTVFGIIGGVRVAENIYLRPLAEMHNITSSKEALVDHVTELLEAQMGASRTDIHTLLDTIGGEASYRDDSLDNSGERETFSWTMIDTPLIVHHSWVLYYDSEDRLTKVGRGDIYP